MDALPSSFFLLTSVVAYRVSSVVSLLSAGASPDEARNASDCPADQVSMTPHVVYAIVMPPTSTGTYFS